MYSAFKVVLTLCCVVFAVSPATPKDEFGQLPRAVEREFRTIAGRSQAPEWVVYHIRQYEVWDSICDYPRGTKLGGFRCYLRLVTKLKPSEGGGAFVIFVVVEEKTISVQMIGPSEGRLTGWLFQPEGLHGYPAGKFVRRLECRDGRICVLDERMGAYFVLRAPMETGVRICIEGADGKIHGKVIPIKGFEQALQDVSMFYGVGPFPTR